MLIKTNNMILLLLSWVNDSTMSALWYTLIFALARESAVWERRMMDDVKIYYCPTHVADVSILGIDS